MIIYLEIVSFILLIFDLTIFHKFFFLTWWFTSYSLKLPTHLSFITFQLTKITFNCHFTIHLQILFINDIYLTFFTTVTFPFVKYQLQLKYSTGLTDDFCLPMFSTSSICKIFLNYLMIKHHLWHFEYIWAVVWLHLR